MDQEPEKYTDAIGARTAAQNTAPPNIPGPPPVPEPPGEYEVKVNIMKEDGNSESPTPVHAPLGTRIAAAVIDCLVSTGIMIALGFILPGFAQRLAWLSAFAYLVTRDSLPFLGGQSVGKKAMKLKVVTLGGESLIGNWNAAFVRNAVLMIPFFPLVELVVLLTREGKPDQGRRLGDEWSKTKVITAEASE